MKAIVLAGGFGTRLRPLTINTPKPMVPVGNLPIMEHVVSLLSRSGLREVKALLYFQPDRIRDYFGDGRLFGISMDYALPSGDRGTAGSVRYALGDLSEPALVISGDVLTDFDLIEAIEWHRSKKAAATILLCRTENPLAYGIVLTDAEGRITRFLEKPSWGEAFSDTINTGIYILEPEAVKLIPSDGSFDFSQDLFPLMLSKGMPLYGRIMDGYWRDVGNVGEYFRAHSDLSSGELKLELKDKASTIGDAIVHKGTNVTIEDNVTFSGKVILGDDVQIGADSSLHNCSIGNRSRIGRNSDLKDSVIWTDTQVGGGAKFSCAIVCAKSQLGDNVQLLDNAIISDECQVGNSATVKANCKIWPGKTVDEGAIVSTSLVWGEKWNRELFSDSKVSGLALTEITPEMAVKLGAAFGATLGKGNSVVISRDASKISRLLSRSVMSGLMAAGVNVSDLINMPVPVIRYALNKGKYAAGIYVRHNPEDFRQLDIIFFHGSGLDMPTGHLKKVERNYFGEDFERASLDDIGLLDRPQRVLRDYQAEFFLGIDVDQIKKAGFKVVIDYSYGSSSQVFPALFSQLGITTTELNAYPDPRRFAVSPAEQAQAMVQLSAIVRSLNADVGFRINSAAEKLSVVDEQGRPMDSQTLLLIVVELFLKTNGPARIAVPVAASAGVEEIAGQYNSEVVRVSNDHWAMMEARRSGKVVFVGGTRGGFIFPGFQTGADAIFSAVRLLEMLARTHGRLGELRSRYEHYIRETVSVPCPWSKRGTVMRKLISESENKKRELVDGIRIFEDGGWVLIIPDRLKASFNIQAESTSDATTIGLINRYRTLLETIQNS